MTETKLLPCPFCGAKPEPINGGEYMFFDHDDACHFETMRRARSVKMAQDEIAAWNTRHEPTWGEYAKLLDIAQESRRTCHVVGTICSDGWTIAQDPLYYHELSCGHEVETLGKEPPSYCPECGARVEP